MPIRTSLSALALFTSLSIAGCATDLELPRDSSKSDEQASKFVGLWTGIDDTQSSCEVFVLAYDENIDEKIPGADDELATQNLSKLRRSMRLRVSLQADEETIFAALSRFDSQASAYSHQELIADNAIDDLVTESIVVTVDPVAETLTSVSYTMDESLHCGDLRLVDSAAPPEVDPDPPETEFVPYPKGAPRR